MAVSSSSNTTTASPNLTIQQYSLNIINELKTFEKVK